MARPELKNRQFTIYARDDADIPRWRDLCQPLTLNAWILEMIEKGIDNRSPRVIDPEEINSLRKENADLKNEIEIVKIKLQEREDMENDFMAEHSQEVSLSKEIVDLLKLKGCLDSNQINEYVISSQKKIEPSIGVHKGYQFRAVKRTLERLENEGLVELTSRGWKWIK